MDYYQDPAAYNDLMSEIAKKTQNEIILLVIVLIVGFVIAYIPYYLLKRRSVNEHEKAQFEEKKMLYSVIDRNSDIAATLTATIDANNLAMTTVLSTISTDTKDLNKAVVHLSDNQTKILEKLDASIKCNTDLKEYVEKSVDQNAHTGDISKYLQEVIRDLEWIKLKLTLNHDDQQS